MSYSNATLRQQLNSVTLPADGEYVFEKSESDTRQAYNDK